jgi:hypothetical protein
MLFLISLESGGHLLSTVESAHVHFELWLFECDLAVSFQQNDNCNLALKERQVLSNTISLSRTEGKEAELFCLSWITLTPSFRPEL